MRDQNVALNPCETGECAAELIAQWWHTLGKRHFRHATELLILADSGGSTGPTNRLGLHMVYEASRNNLFDKLA